MPDLLTIRALDTVGKTSIMLNTCKTDYGKNPKTRMVKMRFLPHKWRISVEWFSLLVAAAMVILAIVEWGGEYTWRVKPSSFMIIAGVAVLFAIYLVLDELRLGKSD